MVDNTKAPNLPSSSTPPGDLGWHLGTVLRGYQARFEEAVAGMPAEIRGFQILSTVVHRDPPNQQALAAHLAIDRTVLTYLLDELVDAGVVDRIPAPTDRRARKIVSTDYGRSLLATYEHRVADAEAALLAGLNAQESETLARLISRLAMDIHSAKPGTNPCESMDHLP